MTTGSTALVLAVVLAAQSVSQPPPTFRVRADLVQVDVVVVDGHGTPVPGLTRTDFTLLDRGRPQTIATFDEVAHRQAPGGEPALPAGARRDTASNQTSRSDRLVVMVVDDLHIYKDRSERARTIAGSVIDAFAPESSMAVLFTSGNHSTQVTEDPAPLREAIDTLRGHQVWRRPHQAIDTQNAAHIDPEMAAETKLARLQKASDARLEDFFDNMAQYKTLQDAARVLGAGDARRKAFVLVSEGIGKDITGLFGAMAPQGDPPQGGAAYGFGDVAATTTTAPNGYHDLALADMMESMRRSNVATYAIDPRGKVESTDLIRECFPPPSPSDPCSSGLTEWGSAVRQAQHGLEIMAEASGGFAVTNTDDFTSGLARIAEDLDHYYLLGFYPVDAKGKGYRPLSVTIPGHPDWKLRFRRGYQPGGAPQRAAGTTPLVALSSGILPRTDLPLRLSAVTLPGAAGVARLVLTIEVSAPRRLLQDADGKVSDTLNYEVLLVDEKKARMRAVTGREGRLTLSPAAASASLPEQVAYLVWESVDVRPGHYEIRVSAISARLALGGSVYLPIDVPDFGGTAPVLGGVVLDYADGPRVPAAPKATAPPLPFLPSLDRTFAAADTLRVYVEAVDRAPRAATGTHTMPSIDVLDARGRVVRSPSPSFTTGDPMRIGATIPLAGLVPGAYVVRAAIGEGTATASRETGFVVK